MGLALHARPIPPASHLMAVDPTRDWGG